MKSHRDIRITIMSNKGAIIIFKVTLGDIKSQLWVIKSHWRMLLSYKSELWETSYNCEIQEKRVYTDWYKSHYIGTAIYEINSCLRRQSITHFSGHHYNINNLVQKYTAIGPENILDSHCKYRKASVLYASSWITKQG